MNYKKQNTKKEKFPYEKFYWAWCKYRYAVAQGSTKEILTEFFTFCLNYNCQATVINLNEEKGGTPLYAMIATKKKHFLEFKYTEN